MDGGEWWLMGILFPFFLICYYELQFSDLLLICLDSESVLN